MGLPTQTVASLASDVIYDRTIQPVCNGTAIPRKPQSTVFDLLYNEYLPFRLFADYMLGKPVAEIAAQFGLPEYWVSERIEAVRLLTKQVRLNLLEPAAPSRIVQ